jgi:hypothetical protein
LPAFAFVDAVARLPMPNWPLRPNAFRCLHWLLSFGCLKELWSMIGSAILVHSAVDEAICLLPQYKAVEAFAFPFEKVEAIHRWIDYCWICWPSSWIGQDAIWPHTFHHLGNSKSKATISDKAIPLLFPFLLDFAVGHLAIGHLWEERQSTEMEANTLQLMMMLEAGDSERNW